MEHFLLSSISSTVFPYVITYQYFIHSRSNDDVGAQMKDANYVTFEDNWGDYTATGSFFFVEFLVGVTHNRIINI